MTTSEISVGRISRLFEAVGRAVIGALDAIGVGISLFGESLFWIAMGRRRSQAVHLAPIAGEMMTVGIGAIPIVSVLSFTIGLMLAIQGIAALETFGAQQQVSFGVALSVTREFAPLITGIVVAGRSGSALAARIATMTISNELDALRVMGIHPVRFLVVPPLVAMLVMVPALALLADFVALTGAGLYITAEIGITPATYLEQLMASLHVQDVLRGLSKALLFGGIVALVGVVNGAQVKDGAEGVGRVTTSSVVQAIALIILTDMIFAYATTR